MKNTIFYVRNNADEIEKKNVKNNHKLSIFKCNKEIYSS